MGKKQKPLECLRGLSVLNFRNLADAGPVFCPKRPFCQLDLFCEKPQEDGGEFSSILSFTESSYAYISFRGSPKVFLKKRFLEICEPFLPRLHVRSKQKNSSLVSAVGIEGGNLQLLLTKDGYEQFGIEGRAISKDSGAYRLVSIPLGCARGSKLHDRAKWCFGHTIIEEFEFLLTVTESGVMAALAAEFKFMALESSRPRQQEEVCGVRVPDVSRQFSTVVGAETTRSKRPVQDGPKPDDDHEDAEMLHERQMELLEWVGVVQHGISEQENPFISRLQVGPGPAETGAVTAAQRRTTMRRYRLNAFICGETVAELVRTLRAQTAQQTGPMRTAVLVARGAGMAFCEPNVRAREDFVWVIAGDGRAVQFYTVATESCGQVDC